MRSIAIAALSAALLLGCSDDDGDDDGNPSDASTRDASTGRADASIDGSIDAGPTRDASIDASTSRATAALESRSGTSVTGTATFTTVNGVVTLTLSISGATPGLHGTHIHVTGDCSAANASSAGGHWNPDSHTHGSGSADAGATSHLGDLGNVTIGADGKGTLTVSKSAWTLGGGGVTDVVGHAVVFHANTDDLVTQDGDAGPGNSGGRQACGVIAL